MYSATAVHVILVFAGVLMMVLGHAVRHRKVGPPLVVAGVACLLGVIVYYVWNVLA